MWTRELIGTVQGLQIAAPETTDIAGVVWRSSRTHRKQRVSMVWRWRGGSLASEYDGQRSTAAGNIFKSQTSH